MTAKKRGVPTAHEAIKTFCNQFIYGTFIYFFYLNLVKDLDVKLPLFNLNKCDGFVKAHKAFCPSQIYRKRD